MTSTSTNRRQGVNAGLAIKVPVRAATTANITLSGEQNIDGVAVVTDDRVLVKNQTDETENGIYVVDTSSWERAIDFDGTFDAVEGTLVQVNQGTTNGSSMWRIANEGTITIDTTLLSFEEALVSASSSHTFLQAGSGAVSRSVQGKLRDVVHVADFGAVADTGADQTSFIQSAINSVLGSAFTPGGIVRFGRGTYTISSLSLPSGVTLEGEANSANRNDVQGATLLDCTSTIGITSTNTYGVGIKNISIKNASTAGIKFTNVQHWIISEVAIFGSSTLTGIHITGTSYFGTIFHPNINGLANPTAVGVKFDDGANENTIYGGCVRQNTTDVYIDNANNIRLIGVDMEGGAGQTSVSLAPVNAADAAVIGCRFEGNTNGIVCGALTTHLTAIGNWYACTNGVVDNSTNHRMGIFEPHLYTATTPGVLSFQLHDANSTGMKIGSTTIKNITGGNNIIAGSGKLLLSPSSGNPVQLDANAPFDIQENHILMTEVGDPAAPDANKAKLYTRDNGGGKTQLVVRFNTGAVQVLATEP